MSDNIFTKVDLSKHRFGMHLLKKGLVSENQLEAAIREQGVTGDKVGVILVRNGFLGYKDMMQAVLETNPSNLLTEEHYASHIPGRILKKHKIMLVAEFGKTLYLAAHDKQAIVSRVLKPYFPGYEFEFLPIQMDRLDAYLEKITDDIENVGSQGVMLLDQLIKNGIATDVSDIHIIPRYNSYTVMYRQDGVRNIVYEGGMDEYLSLLSRIKDRSRMDIAERRIPQDGGFQIENNSRMIDMRVATVPIVTGEYVVIRILDSSRINPELDKLGISRIDDWRKSFSLPDGLAIVTGPTGSGKTTTLQSTIREIDRFGKSIWSVEDPVEYRSPYIGQVSVNEMVGLTFERSIRSFMRSDPDIIILGEVRDEETAKNAVKAAETGHLVLATLHTNSVRGSLDRLKDLGIPQHDLRYILRGVLTQRLIRLLCGRCAGKGCKFCHDSGYAGRSIVSECAYFPNVESIDNVLAGDIAWPTMPEDGYLKYKEGLTDKREFVRVFGADAEELLRREEAGEPVFDYERKGAGFNTIGDHAEVISGTSDMEQIVHFVREEIEEVEREAASKIESIDLTKKVADSHVADGLAERLKHVESHQSNPKCGK